MGAPRVVIGIDGGGSKTRCLVADLQGQTLGEGLAGPANYQVVGAQQAAAHVQAAVDQALGAAGRTLADVAAAGVGLAGVDRPDDQATMRQALAFLAPAAVAIASDAHVALYGALNGAPGAVVIAGTGSVALGMDAAGNTIRAGGWGWILGDEGSGFDLGRRALNAALAAFDGTGPATTLVEGICAAWRLDSLRQVVRKVYQDLPQARVEIAGLVPLILQAATAGDAVAHEILQHGGTQLGHLAATVLRRLSLPPATPPRVAVTGGVLTGSTIVRQAMAAALQAELPTATLIDPHRTPAEGAVLLALRLIHEPLEGTRR